MRDDEIFLRPIARRLWRREAGDCPRRPAGPLQAARIAYLVVRDTIEGPLGLHAASLVYTTLLSFVPLTAISFSVLKGFGIHNQLEPLLAHALAPLGDKASEVAQRVIGFVDKMEVGTLGAIGVGLLVYTAISAVQKVERAFNEIWRVAQARSLARKFADYLSVLLIAPVLMFTALGIAAAVKGSVLDRWLADVPMLSGALDAGGRMAPACLLFVAFAFSYTFLPNTTVRIRPAVIGALVAAGLWLAGAWAFSTFIGDAGSYTAIYQAFATLIVLLIWLDLNWMIVLAGAAIAFYYQHPQCVRLDPPHGDLAGTSAEDQVLAVAAAVARAFCAARPAPGVETLAAVTDLAVDAVASTLDRLEHAGVVVRTAAEPAGYLPAVAPERIPLSQVVHAGRVQRRACKDDLGGVIASLDDAIEGALATALAGRTLKELITGDDTGPRPR